jgi:hypothetical protein
MEYSGLPTPTPHPDGASFPSVKKIRPSAPEVGRDADFSAVKFAAGAREEDIARCAAEGNAGRSL